VAVTLPAAQGAPITSAHLTVILEPTTDLILRITNLREVPLVEYAVRVGKDTTTFHASSESPTSAPVGPGQTREHRIHAPEGESGSRAEIVRLRFADVRYQGADQVRGRARLPGEARRLSPVTRLTDEELKSTTVELRMVLFRDGQVEGRPEAANDLLGLRKARGLSCNREY
jgi:hypothetical protein